MERTFRDKMYDLAILFCLFLISVGVPFDQWMGQPWANLCSSGLKILFLLAGLYILRKGKIASAYALPRGKRWLWCLPLFLIAGSNMLFLLVNGGADPQNADLLWSEAILCLTTAFAEELFFRVGLIETLKEKIKKEWALVLISAGVFGLAHSVNFFVYDPLYVLAQIGYTSVLGLFLALIYSRGGNLLMSALLHFLFNFVNSSLFVCLYHGDWNLSFYLVNGLFGAILLAYWALLAFYKKRPRKA